MSRSIKFIVLLIFFVLGITNANNLWKESVENLNTSNTTISNEIESVHASFTNNDSNINYYPYYGELENESAFDISNAILSQSNFINGLNIPKTLKNGSIIRSMRMTESSFIAEYISDDSDNLAISPTYRYYIYALRHIII